MDPLRWKDEQLWVVDQTALPHELREIPVKDVEALVRAITSLAVRGAPAIGLAGAYGVALACHEAMPCDTGFSERVFQRAEALAAARPTAVNLRWAVSRVLSVLRELPTEAWAERALQEADRIYEEDRKACEAMSCAGAELIRDGGRYLTHCNAGPLATSGHGTALGVFLSARQQGRQFEVLVDETRPLLQGARLSTWELMEAGVPCRLITDSMAAAAMSRLKVDAVFFGADRIARNGDTANKIGSYGLAVSAAYHEIPVYAVAPLSTVDLLCPDGDAIPVEERQAAEVRGYGEICWAPREVEVWNPAFDVVPASLLTGIITELGLVEPQALADRINGRC